MARRDSASEAAPDLGSFHPKSLAAEGASQGFLSFEKIGLKRFLRKKMDAHHEHPFFMHVYWVANLAGEGVYRFRFVPEEPFKRCKIRNTI